jgi:hypothetical protein
MTTVVGLYAWRRCKTQQISPIVEMTTVVGLYAWRRCKTQQISPIVEMTTVVGLYAGGSDTLPMTQ